MKINCNNSGIVTKLRFKKSLFLIILFMYHSSFLMATVRYVKQDAVGNNNGNSWFDAYTDLQDAIDVSVINDTIWVAAGTYLPKDAPDGTISTGVLDRNNAFHLHTNMKIYGGFSGTETLLSERDWTSNLTLLSGDFANNDVVTGGGAELSFMGNDENAYHVIITADLTPDALLDGFTISGGNANDLQDGYITYVFKRLYKYDGGGMYNAYSSPTITNLTFTSNSVYNTGGGMYNSPSSSPVIMNSTFISNSADFGGGAMLNSYSNSTSIVNSTFISNSAVVGGAVLNFSSSSRFIANSSFNSNYAHLNGGAIYHTPNSNLTIINSTFVSNLANSQGGGIFLSHSSIQSIINSIFILNSADSGGGIFNRNSPTIFNATFASNSANSGGAIYNEFYAHPKIYNSIFWSNFQSGSANFQGSDILNSNNSLPTVEHCITQENSIYSTGTGIINNQEPKFEDAANLNFKLKCTSPAINQGTLSGAPKEDIRAFDRAGNPDIGAYEFGESEPLIIERNIENGMNPKYVGMPSISTEWPILNTNNSIFKARNFILLKSGFSVAPTNGEATVFRAEIGNGGCP